VRIIQLVRFDFAFPLPRAHAKQLLLQAQQQE
jgi:hypothetical protein